MVSIDHNKHSASLEDCVFRFSNSLWHLGPVGFEECGVVQRVPFGAFTDSAVLGRRRIRAS